MTAEQLAMLEGHLLKHGREGNAAEGLRVARRRWPDATAQQLRTAAVAAVGRLRDEVAETYEIGLQRARWLAEAAGLPAEPATKPQKAA